jgi:hypothetical protein
MGTKHRSKKRRKKKQLPSVPPAPAKFSVGTLVRVKPGTRDADFNDIPIGGWTGTILEIGRQSQTNLFLVEWNQATLDQLHPVFRKRCERDDLEMEEMWLEEDELELDTGEPVKIEQPTALISRPLTSDDQDDRIRIIFELTSDDPLPDINDENVRRYHRYLASHLSFPFQAICRVETGILQEMVTVTRLLDADRCDEDEGILCEAMLDGEPIDLYLTDLELPENSDNRQLIEDYAYWFGTGVDRSSAILTSAEWFATEPSPNPLKQSSWWSIPKYVIGGAITGISLGSLLAAMEIAQIGAIVGAILVGLLGSLLGTRSGRLFGAVYGYKRGSFYGGALGTIVGGITGVLVGAMLVAIVGVAIGGMIGALITLRLRRGKRMLVVALGGAAGAFLQALYFDQQKAITGAIYGAIIGVATGIAIFLAIFQWWRRLMSRRYRR